MTLQTEQKYPVQIRLSPTFIGRARMRNRDAHTLRRDHSAHTINAAGSELPRCCRPGAREIVDVAATKRPFPSSFIGRLLRLCCPFLRAPGCIVKTGIGPLTAPVVTMRTRPAPSSSGSGMNTNPDTRQHYKVEFNLNALWSNTIAAPQDGRGPRSPERSIFNALAPTKITNYSQDLSLFWRDTVGAQVPRIYCVGCQPMTILNSIS
jgi:hypothetical protein